MCCILICVGMFHISLNIFDIFIYMFDMLIDISICLLICIYIYIWPCLNNYGEACNMFNSLFWSGSRWIILVWPNPTLRNISRYYVFIYIYIYGTMSLEAWVPNWLLHHSAGLWAKGCDMEFSRSSKFF